MDTPYSVPRYLPPSGSPAELLRRQRIAYEIDQKQRAYSASVANRQSIIAQTRTTRQDRFREEEEADKRRQRRTILIISIIVIIVIILFLIGIAIAIWYFFFRSTGPSGGTPVPPECTSDTQCTDNFRCINGVCKGGTGAGCIAFIDCQSGICYGGVCKGDKGNSCTVNSDCAAPYGCNAGICGDIMCATNLDCPANSTCYVTPFNGCVLNFETPCTKDSECTAGHPDVVGLRCINSKCLRTGGGSCTDKADCVSNICTSGECSCTKREHCLSDQNCTGSVCNPEATNVIYG